MPEKKITTFFASALYFSLSCNIVTLMEDVMSTQKYRIPDVNFSFFERKIEETNKKAKKLGCAEITYKILSTHVTKADPMKSIGSFDITWFVVEVTGETPKLNGWKFNGVLTQVPLADGTSQNHVKCVPGETVPKRFRYRVGACDHCNYTRKRKETYVIENEQTNVFKMVGSSCLKDFLGHKNPHQIGEMVSYLYSLDSYVTDLQDEYFNGSGNYTVDIFSLQEFLSWTISVIGKYGWMNRANARENTCKSTADHVMYYLCPPRKMTDVEAAEFAKEYSELIPTDEHGTDADRIIEWAQNIPESECENDFMYNLNLIAKFNAVTADKSGIAAAMVVTHRFKMKKETEAKKKNKEFIKSVHVGVIGERKEMVLTTKSIFKSQSDFGVTGIHKIIDDMGNYLTWFASESTSWLEVDATYKVKATVKDHGEYKGIKQTIVNRIKILEKI